MPIDLNHHSPTIILSPEGISRVSLLLFDLSLSKLLVTKSWISITYVVNPLIGGIHHFPSSILERRHAMMAHVVSKIPLFSNTCPNKRHDISCV